MKENTRKILFLFFDTDPTQKTMISSAQLAWLLPSITASGQRSLLYLMVNNGLLSQVGGVAEGTYVITQKGVDVSSQLFPAFNSGWSTWDQSWSVISFISDTEAKYDYRKLRAEMPKNRYFPLSRGTYVTPQHLAAPVLELCNREYRGGVITSVTTTSLVNDYSTWNYIKENQRDLHQIYSGLSRESARLLASFDAKKSSSSKDKNSIAAVLDSFFQICVEDTGLVLWEMGWEASVKKLILLKKNLLECLQK